MKQYVLREGEHAELSVSYGFAVLSDGRVAAEYADVSDSRAEMERFVAALNELQPDERHIDDILEDFLTDFCL